MQTVYEKMMERRTATRPRGSKHTTATKAFVPTSKTTDSKAERKEEAEWAARSGPVYIVRKAYK